MRFKKGSKVEVLNERQLPLGSWRCAETISGNGHYYYVRYGLYPANMGAAMGRVEIVPRKAIRSSPPAVDCLRNWVPGDIVEVFNFDNSSWKLAEVLRVVGGNYCFKYRAHSSNIRLRQSWQDNKWTVIKKDSGKCSNGTINRLPKEGKFICQMPQPCVEVKNCAQDDHFAIDNDVFEKLPRVVTKGAKKRPQICSLPVETCTGGSRKMRAVEREGRCQRLVAEHSPNLQKKVDAVASPRPMLGEKYMHASLNNKTTGFSKMNRGEGIPDVDDESYSRASLEPSDTVSIPSSVGSCSPSSSPYRSLHHPGNGFIQDLCNNSDVAETSSGSGREPSLPTKEASAKIHQLELHAYRTTMLALYASGPLSWDQEALLTNLRLMLHISNDEHLLELRKLVSTEKDLPFRLAGSHP